MRRRASLTLLAVAFLGAACDTDQPPQLAGHQVELDFTARFTTGQFVVRYDVWNLYEDSDGNGNPDDITGDGIADTSKWCREVSRGPATVPWTYSLVVKLLPAGQLVPQLLTSAAAENQDGRNLTEYDASSIAGVTPNLAPVTLVMPRGRCSGKKAIRCRVGGGTLTDPCTGNGTCQPVCSGDNTTSCSVDADCLQVGGTCGALESRTFVFDNSGSRRVFASNAEFDGNPLRNALTAACSQNGCPGVEFEPGYCPSHNLGPARLDGAPPPLDLFLDSGATLSVEARRFESVPQASGFELKNGALVTLNPLVAVPLGTNPSSVRPLINASLVVDGGLVQPGDIDGETQIIEGNTNTAISFIYRAN
jgi:hypothetical protein